MKLLGYCPDCRIGITEVELDLPCRKCGSFLCLDVLGDIPAKAVTKQTGNDLLKRDYKIQVAGVKNGGTTVKRRAG